MDLTMPKLMMWTCSQTMLFINITIHIIILAAFYCLCLIKKIRLFGTISQLMTAVVTEEQVKTIQAELVATIIKNKAFSIIG